MPVKFVAGPSVPEPPAPAAAVRFAPGAAVDVAALSPPIIANNVALTAGGLQLFANTNDLLLFKSKRDAYNVVGKSVPAGSAGTRYVVAHSRPHSLRPSPTPTRYDIVLALTNPSHRPRPLPQTHDDTDKPSQ